MIFAGIARDTFHFSYKCSFYGTGRVTRFKRCVVKCVGGLEVSLKREGSSGWERWAFVNSKV